jgi:hypothetical protein
VSTPLSSVRRHQPPEGGRTENAVSSYGSGSKRSRRLRLTTFSVYAGPSPVFCPACAERQFAPFVDPFADRT